MCLDCTDKCDERLYRIYLDFFMILFTKYFIRLIKNSLNFILLLYHNLDVICFSSLCSITESSLLYIRFCYT